MMIVMTLILMFFLGCPLLAEFQYYVNRSQDMSLRSSELPFEILLGCPFDSWFSPPECVSLVVSHKSYQWNHQAQIDYTWRKNNQRPFSSITSGRWYQFSANRKPEFGLQWRRKRYSVKKTAQLFYIMATKTARLWGGPGARWPWGETPLWRGSCALLCSGLPHSALVRCLWCFSSSWGNMASMERESVHPEPQGSLLL